MTSISDIIKQVEPTFGPFTEKMQAAFKKNLLDVFGGEVSGEIRIHFMLVYDELSAIEESQTGAAIKGKDPLSLKSLRNVFERQIIRELIDNVTQLLLP